MTAVAALTGGVAVNPMLVGALSMVLLAQTEPSVTKEERAAARAEVLKKFQEEVDGYEIRQESPPPVRLELSRPLLNWGNTERNQEDGAVYVWLNEGRPEVIGTVFTFQHKATGKTVLKHCLHTLSQSPLTAEHNGQPVWAPRQPGLKFEPVPGAEAPADSSRARLVQMRTLARKFSVSLEGLKGEKAELRLLTQPLIRYEPKGQTAQEVKDGAIFAFAAGTDPDTLLVLEAHRHEGAWRWKSAFARFHFVTLTGFYNGKQVWNVPADRTLMTAHLGDTTAAEKIYVSLIKPE